MSGAWEDDSINCDFKSVHCKLGKFERDLQAVTNYAGNADNASMEGLLVEKRSLEDRINLLQRELNTLDQEEGSEVRSHRGRDIHRTTSPGELSKPRGRTRSYQQLSNSGRPPQSSRRSSSGGGGGCNCRCNSFFSSDIRKSDPERDNMLFELRQQMREVNAEKHALQEQMFTLEEGQRQDENDTQMLRSQLDGDRIKARQLEEENGELQEEIQRLELALNNLPVGDSGATRDAAAQISHLLQALNDDMVKAPELCNRLRMAAQQIMDGEKRLTNERSTRAMDQAEVQYLRSENQRLRELAFRANMSAFQASVQLPQNPMAGFQQAMGPPFGPGGACMDPYATPAANRPPPQRAAAPPRKKTRFQRMFNRSQPPDDIGPSTIQFEDGSQAQYDPAMTMQQQRLSLALSESPEDAARRVQMLSQQRRRKGCCPR